MYITLIEYHELGGVKELDSTTFERLESRAWNKLNMRTQGRIKEPLDNIKRLMVELIDLEDEMRNLDVKQVSNDGVSVTYNSAGTFNQRFEELVVAYAGKLAWRGVDDVSKTS